MSSDFDEFMKQSEGGDQEEPSELFELEVSDKKGPRSLVDQLKNAINYDGSDTANEVLLLSCEEFMAICQREIETFKKTIAELKEMKRVKTEKAAGSAEEVNPQEVVGNSPRSLEDRAAKAARDGDGKFATEMAKILDEWIKKS